MPQKNTIFEISKDEMEYGGPCLEWIIKGDLEFPSNDEYPKRTEIHICCFEQIEEWVEKWGKYLREKGIIPERGGVDEQ